MRYCPNDDCPDFVAIGFRQEFTSRTPACPVCGTRLVEGEPPIEEAAPPLARVAGSAIRSRSGNSVG